jgi:SulP family sulfate permease
LKASELVVDEFGVVRERLAKDAPCRAYLLYDFEGEMFFGAAPDLEHYLSELTARAQREGIHHAVLRVKRLRNPDMMCLEQLENFLERAPSRGLTVFLARLRSNLLETLQRVGFDEWFPRNQIFTQGPDEDSATLAAIRKVYEQLGDANQCDHCRTKRASVGRDRWLYYRV